MSPFAAVLVKIEADLKATCERLLADLRKAQAMLPPQTPAGDVPRGTAPERPTLAELGAIRRRDSDWEIERTGDRISVAPLDPFAWPTDWGVVDRRTLLREVDALRTGRENLLNALERKQAQIDALMLKLCPGEMPADDRARAQCLADRFSAATDQAHRVALALEAFGKSGIDMVRIMAPDVPRGTPVVVNCKIDALPPFPESVFAGLADSIRRHDELVKKDILDRLNGGARRKPEPEIAAAREEDEAKAYRWPGFHVPRGTTRGWRGRWRLAVERGFLETVAGSFIGWALAMLPIFLLSRCSA